MAVSSWSYTAPPTTALAPSASPRTNSFGVSRRSCREHDVLTCHKCGGHREVRALVSSPTFAREVLEALGVAFERLQIAKAHDPPSQESFDLGPAFDGLDPSYPD